jgi:hypothetical protein
MLSTVIFFVYSGIGAALLLAIAALIGAIAWKIVVDAMEEVRMNREKDYQKAAWAHVSRERGLALERQLIVTPDRNHKMAMAGVHAAGRYLITHPHPLQEQESEEYLEPSLYELVKKAVADEIEYEKSRPKNFKDIGRQP